MRTLFTLLLLVGCSAEGEPHGILGSGETVKFTSASACRQEAMSLHPDGTPRFYGYECRKLRFGRVYEVDRYVDGYPEGVKRTTRLP